MKKWKTITPNVQLSSHRKINFTTLVVMVYGRHCRTPCTITTVQMLTHARSRKRQLLRWSVNDVLDWSGPDWSEWGRSLSVPDHFVTTRNAMSCSGPPPVPPVRYHLDHFGTKFYFENCGSLHCADCSANGLGHVRYQTRSVPNHFGTKNDVFGTTCLLRYRSISVPCDIQFGTSTVSVPGPIRYHVCFGTKLS